ncbi:unnamed protein product, partial [Laminaria digitata]
MQTTHRTTLMLRAKVVVVGDACVGKTAIVQMLKSGGHDYPKSYIMVRASFLSGRPIFQLATSELYCRTYPREDCPVYYIF